MELRKRSRPSPAIVVAVLALVAALGGTAVAGPSADTAGTAQKALSKAKKAQKKAKKANKKAKSALGSAELAQSTADAAFPLTAVVAANGDVSRGTEVTSTNARLGSGLYTVEFTSGLDLSNCAWVGQIGNGNTTPTIYGEMSTWLDAPNAIFVQTASSAGALADRPFQLLVSCPEV